MATGRLIGNPDTGAGPVGAPYVFYWKFTCEATGKVIEFRTYGTVNGNVKVAIYSDNAGEPGDRLVYNDSSQPVTADQWNSLSIPELSVTKDTVYWLAAAIDTNDCIGKSATSGGTGRYKSITYSSWTWPATAGSGFNNSTSIFCLAAWGILVLSPSSISQPVSYGSPRLSRFIKPSGTAQQIAYGQPAVITSALNIYPQGIAVVVSAGMPVLRYPQFITPSGIAQPVSIGTPSAGIFVILSPQGISVIVCYGSPSLYKYVWHVVLDGQYSKETPYINRAYIIGRDQYGNPVYGTAVDSTELGLVGERLDFQQELAIPTESQASSMASAILSKMRLSKVRGFILIPPNCGQELFDVVQISDSGANQSAVKFRVVGIRFEYNPKQSRYEHRLLLGAP